MIMKITKETPEIYEIISEITFKLFKYKTESIKYNEEIMQTKNNNPSHIIVINGCLKFFNFNLRAATLSLIKKSKSKAEISVPPKKQNNKE